MNVQDIQAMIKDYEQRRVTQRESSNRREDLKKHRQQAKEDMPAYLEKIDKITHVDTMRKRGRLDLPAPAVSDAELSEVVILLVIVMLDRQVRSIRTSTSSRRCSHRQVVVIIRTHSSQQCHSASHST